MTLKPGEATPLNQPVSQSDSLPRRLRAYLDERFPLMANGLLILSFYSSNQFLAHVLDQPGEAMRYDLGSLAGYLVILLFFLHLRIFDDHKDFETDSIHYPNRVLQRNVTTLHELKLLGFFVIASEFLLAGILGMSAVVALAMAFAFSLLMYKEFFVRDWLKRHFLLYASSHMLVMPLLALAVWSFATQHLPWQAPKWFWLYSLVSFFLAFNWEVSRKIRTPENEVDGIDSYTRIFGTYGAAYLVLLIRLIDSMLVVAIAWHLGFSQWFYALILLLYLVCLIGVYQYRFHTSPATARLMELYAGVYILSFDLALVFELGLTYGIQFSGTL